MATEDFITELSALLERMIDGNDDKAIRRIMANVMNTVAEYIPDVSPESSQQLSEPKPMPKVPEPSHAQIETALREIAAMASSLESICVSILEHASASGGAMAHAAEIMARQIGWYADMCLDFKVRRSEQWFLGDVFESESEVSHG